MSQDLGGGLLMRVESCALVIAAGVHICMHLSPSQTSSPPTSESGGVGESDESTSARVRTWGLEFFAFGFSANLTVVSTVTVLLSLPCAVPDSTLRLIRLCPRS